VTSYLKQEVAYGLSIDTDLDDLERCNSPDFAFFSPNSIAFWPITSQWLKTDL